MEVHVVMSNDFPDSVWAVKADAEEFCKAKMEEQWKGETDRLLKALAVRIYYRVYTFTLETKK